MSITVKRTGSAEYGKFIKALVAGDPGAGKTLFSSTFPEPLYLSAEGGLMSVADRNVPYIEITRTDELFRLIGQLRQPPHVRADMMGVPVQTVIIDTIDEVQRMAMRERLLETKAETFSQQDWGWLGDKMAELLRMYRNLPLNVVFTCHVKETRDEQLGRIVYKPQLAGRTGDEISGYVDIVGLLTARSRIKAVDDQPQRVTERTLVTAPDDQHPWLKDRSGKLPAEFPVTFDRDYERIAELVFANVTIAESQDLATVDTRPEPPAAAPKAEKAKPANPGQRKLPEPPKPKSDKTFTCEDCDSTFNDVDQADLSNVKFKATLCAPCMRKRSTAKD